ncbi:MAG: amidohydrolase [Nocardioides sp.]|uniref:amidohydrolase n=1 Tax=Nocardioides sp. TaxID=35761 RepID=UPI0039E38315
MSATLAIIGADIRTMDPQRPRASAVALDGDTIVAVGDDAEIREVCDGATEILDGRGWHLTPGLTDGHQHLLEGATIAQGIDFDRVGTLDRARTLVAAERDRVGPGSWLYGYALEYSTFGGRPYHHTMFDDVSGGRPMFVFALDLHTGFANAEALRLAGVTGARDFPDSSSIVVDDEGKPTGELRERSAVEVVLAAIPPRTPAQTRALQIEALRRQNAVGLTAIHQMDGDPDALDAFEALEAEDALTMTVAVHNILTPTMESDYIDELLATPPRSGRRWRSDGVKFWLDGVVETGTAWLEHADDRGGGTEPNWPSLPDWEVLVRRCHDAGRRIATHAIGDRAVRETLDVYSRIDGAAGRHRIEHIETAPDQIVGRFRPEGITASVQPIHMRWIAADFSDPWSQRLDHDQCQHAMPSGDLSAAGALVVLGSDWPVAPYDPRLGIFAAQLRRSPDVDDPAPVGASRPLTGEETLAGYTINAARAVGEGDVAGMLRPGYRADVVAWADDIATCNPVDVPDLPVLLTVQAGRIVHRAPEVDPA